MATSPLLSPGSPPLQSGGQNQKWPTCAQSGYVAPALSGITTASERQGNSEVAHLLVRWLHQPCRLGDLHRFRAGGKVRSGLLVGKVATSPLLARGSPPLQSGREIPKWHTCGQGGHVTPAVSGIPTPAGIPTASERGAKSEVAHLQAKWLCPPCHLRDPNSFTAGGQIRSGLLVGKMATSPLPSRGSSPLRSRGGNQNWPSCGQGGYFIPAISGIPAVSEQVAKSEVAHLWAKWLCHRCRLMDHQRFRGGGQNQKCPTCGQSGYVTPAVSGIPTAAEGQGKSEMAHFGARWLSHPCGLWDPDRFTAGGGIRSGPLVGTVATSPLTSQGSPPLQSGGAKSEVAHLGARWLRHLCRLREPTASERGARSEVAYLWARPLCHPCCLGDPHRFPAGGKIRRGLLV